MSNNLVGNPLYVDTAGASSVYEVAGRKIKLDKVYWFSPATANDTFNLIDSKTSKSLLAGVCEADGQAQVFDFAEPVEAFGLEVLTLSSGSLWIYFHY